LPTLVERGTYGLVDIDPKRLFRADRLGGLVHEYRMVA
jgi:hypothetical protein